MPVRISSRYANIPTEGGDRIGRRSTWLRRETVKRLVRGTVVSRSRDDLRPGLQMATSGRHCIFFEAEQSRVVVVRVLHDRMDYRRHLETNEPPEEQP